MRTISLALNYVLFAAMCMVGCADGAGNDLDKNVAALTDECIADCVERGGDAPRCAESCASIGGADCVTRCTESGGNESACADRCDASGTPACLNECMEAGGDMETCRLACWNGEDETPVVCTDGDEMERDGVMYVCADGEWVAQGN